jgi:myo-inositol-hexaphosphate 3-phosphohydrolase
MKKIAQNVAEPIFVKMNAQLLPWEKIPQNFGLLV